MTLDKILEVVQQNAEGIIASIIVGLIGSLSLWVLAKVRRNVRNLSSYFQRLDRANRAVDDERGLWAAFPVQPSSPTPTSRVLVVANAKGGVGKTTVVGNLAAALAPRLTRPILLIDLDFQGSLSAMAIGEPALRVPAHGRSLASKLIAGQLTVDDLDAQRVPLASGETRIRVVPAGYDLAREENRVMVKWLVGERTDDVRFILHKILHDPHVQREYGLVIIDCAPRITTATVQALAAGTHILIPTILDGLSTEAVSNFAGQVESFRTAGVCPQIEYLGVLPTMLLPTAKYDQAYIGLQDGLRSLPARIAPPAPIPVIPSPIWASNAVRKAYGSGFAYRDLHRTQAALRVKQSFDDLAQYTINRMGLAVSTETTVGTIDGQQNVRQGSSRVRETEANPQLTF